MGDKITTMLAVAFASFLLLLTISLVSSSYNTRTTLSLVEDFVNDVTYRGYFTSTEYNRLIGRIPLKNIKVVPLHYKHDPFQYEDPDVYNIIFSNDIITEMRDNGSYVMGTGDVLRLDVILIGRNSFDAMMGAFAGSGSAPFKTVVSRNAVIFNEKYSE